MGFAASEGGFASTPSAADLSPLIPPHRLGEAQACALWGGRFGFPLSCVGGDRFVDQGGSLAYNWENSRLPRGLEESMRRDRILKAVALMLVVSVGFLSSGCFGKFQLTRKVYEVNKSMEEKYSRSALTWVLVIVPVYAIAGILDFVVFNVVEFWSGQNPLDQQAATRVYENGKDRAVLTIGREAGATVATLEQFRDGVRISTLRIRDDGSGSVTADVVENGKVTRRMTARIEADGSATVATAGASGPEIARVSRASVQVWAARVSRAADRATAAAAAGLAPVAATARVPALAG